MAYQCLPICIITSLSYQILLELVIADYSLSYFFLSYLVISCHILSYHILSYLVTFYHILSHLLICIMYTLGHSGPRPPLKSTILCTCFARESSSLVSLLKSASLKRPSILMYLILATLCLSETSFAIKKRSLKKRSVSFVLEIAFFLRNPPAPVGAKGRVFPEALAIGSFS